MDNIIDSLFRLYKKKGPRYFKIFIKENPIYEKYLPLIKKMDSVHFVA